jgi:sugar O-acyltransferase (sialic acid O-acetyltransferase NeuD family)
MSQILLLGAGGHFRSCVDVIELAGFTIAGVIAPAQHANQDTCGYPIIGDDCDLPMLREKFKLGLVTIGQIKSSKKRIELFELLRQSGYELPQVSSPLSYISRRAFVGLGTIVMHGAIVNSCSRIGENCIINTHALIEHDAEIGSHCHISTGAKVNGGALIGERTFVGSGAILHEGVKIGAGSIIGAGATIKCDVPANSLVR